MHWSPPMTHHSERHDGGGAESVDGDTAASDSPTADLLDGLLETVEALGGADEQRREPLLERAEDRGLDRSVAEQVYDISREENLLPAYGLALVLHQISVVPFDSSSTQVDTSEPNEPEWVDAPPGPRQAERERRLRQTFRRLRSHLDGVGDPASAVHGFAREPDLETHSY